MYPESKPRREEKFIFLLLLLRLWPLQILSSYIPGGEDPVHVRSLGVS